VSDSPNLTTQEEHVSRIVSINIPLKVLLPLVGVAIAGMVNMHFTLTNLVESFKNVQATVQKTNDSLMAMQTEVAVLRIKHENLESAFRTFQAQRSQP
jgi:uncharacterized membrane protein YgaE (UPF0421/DUF939 family)